MTADGVDQICMQTRILGFFLGAELISSAESSNSKSGSLQKCRQTRFEKAHEMKQSEAFLSNKLSVGTHTHVRTDDPAQGQ